MRIVVRYPRNNKRIVDACTHVTEGVVMVWTAREIGAEREGA
jgi:hypothetical protein